MSWETDAERALEQLAAGYHRALNGGIATAGEQRAQGVARVA